MVDCSVPVVCDVGPSYFISRGGIVVERVMGS